MKNFCNAIVASAVLVLGCGDATKPPTEPHGGGDVIATPDLGRACAASCTSDSQCQSSCPSVASGLNCCDQLTKTCFATAYSYCPAPPADMSVVGPY